MDISAYSVGWISGFLAGFALGGLVIHALTLLYWHTYIRGIATKLFKPPSATDKSSDSEDLMQGLAAVLPHLMRRGRQPFPHEQ